MDQGLAKELGGYVIALLKLELLFAEPENVLKEKGKGKPH